MMMKFTFLVLFVLVLGCHGKVSDKEYASMPDVFYMDNYDKCMMRGDESFFCSFDYHLEPLDSKNISDTWRIIQDVISDRMNYRHDRLRHYICVRDHCPGIPIMDENDPELWRLIEDCYNEKYEHMGLKGKITRMMCDTETTNRYPIGYFEILVAILLISYFGYVIFATFLEGVYRYKSEEEYNKFVNSPFGKFVAPFSLTINWIRLKAVKDGHPDIERLRCIQGVRTYNLLLVILSHTALSNLSLPLSNTRYAETVTEKFLNIFLSSGPLCVSTFFLMAGFLLAYGLFDYSEGKKELKPKELAMIFINRCIRLTPTLAFVLIIHATWLPHVSNGPLWDQYIGNEYRVCRKNWWTNLLYLHTYVNSEEMCMMQTWYLAVDTQFFILGLVLIYYMKKYENKIPLILGSCLGLHIVFTFIMNYIYDYEATIFPEPEIYYNIQLQKLGQWHSQLTASYGNIPGLVVGMAYGYAYYKYKNVKLFTSTRSVVFWWFTVLLLPLGIIIFPGLIIYDPNTPKNIFWASVYISLCRTVFTTGIGLVIFGVSQGIGWIAKMSLEWRPTYILGRIVYSSFLIHVALIKIRPALKRYPTYLEDFIIVSDLLCDIFTAFLSGLLLTLFVEMPISELQKLLVPQKRSKGEQQQQEKQEQEDEKKKIK